jgi:hypothetical protein
VPYAALATRWCRNADWVGPNQHGGHRGGDTAQSADWLSGMLVSPCERLDIGFMVWAVERGWSLGFGARDCNLVGVGFGCVYSQGVSPPHTFIIITIADSKASNIFIASEHYTSTTPYQPQTIHINIHKYIQHYHTMSSPATQYVYIPNLVGRQMLRIPIDEVEAEGQISIEPAPQSTSTPRYTRDSSPSPSVSSIEQEE